MKCASPDVMNARSVAPRYDETFVSKAMRSLFSSSTLGDAAVGWFARMCHQLVLAFGLGVGGSALLLPVDG